MESYDERRGREEERRQGRNEDDGRHRDTWWRPEGEHEGDHPRRAERGWLDYDREYGRSDQRQGQQGRQRYDRGGDERARFSPDWSREGAQPRYSDDPYYSRNRDAERSQGPYAGRGPKGYRRSDQQILEEACQRLERDGEIDASEIEVSAEDGVIRLRGKVHDRHTKRRAEQCVESIYGAHDVMNELRVPQPHASQGMPTRGQLPGAGSSTAEQIGDGTRPPKH